MNKINTGVNRRERRLLLRRGARKDERVTYLDNKGCEYDYKWVAKIASLFNVIIGCFHNGFPVVVPKLWYPAWAFYPFFFVRSDLRVADPIAVLNHERIHVRQQYDIHLLVGLPLLVFLCYAEINNIFNVIPYLCTLPFIPTVLYMLNFGYAFILHRLIRRGKVYRSLQEIRSATCFEREAICHAPNADYLHTRKFLAVLKYTGIKIFR